MWKSLVSIAPAFVIVVMTTIGSSLAEGSSILVTGAFVAGSKTDVSPLKGGSYGLVFDVTGLPLNPGSFLPLYTWDLTFRDAAGDAVTEINAFQSGTHGTIRALTGKTLGDVVTVADANNQNVLELLFAEGFSGSGNVVKSSTYSFGIADGLDKVNVKAGSITPEPTTWGLLLSAFAIGCFSYLGRHWRFGLKWSLLAKYAVSSSKRQDAASR